MQYYLAIWSLAFGLVIGSFLNVVIYRLPRRESLSHPGSHCPRCGMAIRWYDNIPVVSWLLLRCRCRGCHSPIAVRYPLVESLTGAVFLGSFIAVGAKPAVLFAWFLTALVITMLFIEHDTGMIPDRLVVPATVCALAGAVALDVHHWWYYVAGCVGSGAFALLLALSIPRAARFGDAKMAIFLGAALGPYAAIALPIMLVLRLLAAIALVFGRKGRLRAKTLLIPISTDRDVARRMEVLQENAAKVDAEVMTWL